jgi:hypothetical protein
MTVEAQTSVDIGLEPFYEKIMARLNHSLTLESMPLDSDLAEVRVEDKKIHVRSAIWQADKFRKITVQRFTNETPAMDTLNMGFYPELCYAAPLFRIHILATARAIITVIHPMPPLQDEGSREAYIAPMVPMLNQYEEFPIRKNASDWVMAYHNEAGIYSNPPIDRLEDLKSCVYQYLDFYLDAVAAAPEVTDVEAREQIRAFHEKYAYDVITYDRALEISGRFYGEGRAKKLSDLLNLVD